MGLCTIHGPSTFHFRTDPNSITWQYTLNTHVDRTYGGRVIQLLSANVDSLTVSSDSGAGGRAYQRDAALYFRDFVLWQRDHGNPGTFAYPNNNILLKVYADNFQWNDSLGNVLRNFTMTFRVEEDSNGATVKKIMNAELDKLADGIGYHATKYNTPDAYDNGTKKKKKIPKLPIKPGAPGGGGGVKKPL